MLTNQTQTKHCLTKSYLALKFNPKLLYHPSQEKLRGLTVVFHLNYLVFTQIKKYHYLKKISKIYIVYTLTVQSTEARTIQQFE